MPRIFFNWLAGMMMPDAVLNHAITGWDRKFARNPNRKNSRASKMVLDIHASVIVATIYSEVLGIATLLTAATFSSGRTTTGPTVNA
jgi:hypothetical protein